MRTEKTPGAPNTMARATWTRRHEQEGADTQENTTHSARGLMGSFGSVRGSPATAPTGSAARDVRRHAAPPPVRAPPDIRVAARAGLTVGLGVRGARVDDADVAHHLDPHVLNAEVRNGARLADERDERGAIGERAVCVAV